SRAVDVRHRRGPACRQSAFADQRCKPSPSISEPHRASRARQVSVVPQQANGAGALRDDGDDADHQERRRVGGNRLVPLRESAGDRRGSACESSRFPGHRLPRGSGARAVKALAFTLLASQLMASGALAEQALRPASSDSRILLATYRDSEVYKIVASYGFQTT